MYRIYTQRNMAFEDDVSSVDEIANCYQPGLQAVKNVDRSRISPANSRLLCGSVDLDSCLQNQYPQDNRWDYIICYENTLYFVEVHPASTSEVNTMVAKALWLRNWWNQHKNNFNTGSKSQLYWISSGSTDKILPSSTYGKRLAKSGIKMVGNNLKLPE